MAGKPGRSGGARPGAGRKPKPPDKPLTIKADDPLEFLLEVMQDPEANPTLRVRAAIAAVQYKHHKKGEGGSKDAKNKAAQDAGGGRFGAGAPPKLAAVK